MTHNNFSTTTALKTTNIIISQITNSTLQAVFIPAVTCLLMLLPVFLTAMARVYIYTAVLHGLGLVVQLYSTGLPGMG